MSILPIGDVDREVLEMLKRKLAFLPFKITILDKVAVPKEEYNRDRGQFRADPFLDLVEEHPGDRVLGVTEVDLYSKGRNNRNLNFVFGQAQILGKAAVISLYQLRGEREVYHQRALKEAVHELGHTMGLRHCADKTCVMHFSDSLADTDLKEAAFCETCLGKLKSKGMI